jgi:hypothetical protein
MRIQNMLNRASPPAIMITVSSTKAGNTLPGIHKDLTMPPFLEDVATTASPNWSSHFHTMPATIDG